MARHLFVLLLAAICLVQVAMSLPRERRDADDTTEGAANILEGIERLASDLSKKTQEFFSADSLRAIQGNATELANKVWCGRPIAAEEALRVLNVERQMLLETSDLLSQWRYNATDRPRLAEQLRGLAARRDQLLADQGVKLNWTDRLSSQEPTGPTDGSTAATEVGPLAQEAGPTTRASGEGQGSTRPPSTAGWSGWAWGASEEAEAAATGEVADLLRQEAPSAEELHRLADEFRRIWRQHQRRFRRLDAEASDEE